MRHACNSNPDHCAINTNYNPITEEKCASSPVHPSPYCPSGWTLMPDNSCIASATSSEASNSGSSSGAASSVPSNHSSTPSNSNSSAPQKPPTSPGDNTDQNQPTNNSQSIPVGTSNATCLANASASACKAVEDCKLTFGVDRCAGVTENIMCPNSYVINGQKICVLPSGSNGSASSSGSGTSSGSNSSQAGECDPTAKSYDECMGRNKIPDGQQTAKIKNDLEAAANKSLDDYNKARKDDIDSVVSNGVSFKSAPDALKAAFLSHVPQPSACVNIPIVFLGVTKNLDCALFEKFKVIFAWFLSLVTMYYIFQLAIKPVER